MRLARLEPFLSRYDRVAWHRSSPSKSSGLVWVVESVSPAPLVPRSLVMASAASPPPEVAPATISAAVARHAGHMGHLLHPIRRSGGAQIDRIEPQSSIAWYTEVQKSRQTSGGTGEVQARW